jgi:two-component system, NarL family, sensor kinase
MIEKGARLKKGRRIRVEAESSKARSGKTHAFSVEDDLVLPARPLSLQDKMQQRIASDLHDSTCQHLIAATLHLQRLRHPASDARTTNKICDEVDFSIREALNEIRAYSYLLYPSGLLSAGLKRTIEEYVKGFSARTSLNSIVHVTPKVQKLPYATQCSLLRLIQEALTNVYRHANATRVQILVEAGANTLRIRVIDNGCGIPVNQTEHKAISIGVGIQGMRSRMQQLGGTFEIISSTGTRPGTVVCARLPASPSTASCRGGDNKMKWQH